MRARRVVIVDDHPVVREGLRTMLHSAPEIDVVADTGDPLAALSLAQRLRPDVMLSDVRMPVISGIELAARVYATNPEVAVIVLSNYEEPELIQSAFRAHARGYLLKTATLSEIVDALNRVAAGERVLSPALINGVLNEYSGLAQEHAERASGLGPDELRILRYLVAGIQNHEIASLEFISEATVKRRIHSIYQKLQVADRTHAIQVALRQGIV
jgi:DNA-binding NarL/FixJ family response regulator